jgi:hypothetical protein
MSSTPSYVFSPDEQPATSFDEATDLSPIAADSQSHRWSTATRIGFRFAFCYLAAYCLCNGNATALGVIPKFGDKLQDWLADIFVYPAQYLAGHLFHIAPPGDKIHPTGSGDTAINWISVLLVLVLSALATVIWSALDRRRPHYQTLSAWLRFLVRLTIGLGMVNYGLYKVLPMQMPVPSITSLSEPYGMHSPMAILWSFIGINPVYEIICGTAELLGGLLILFRRTALFGALLTAFVVTNILLYNLCFDVPVKLYAGHLLLLSLFVTLPDVVPLYRFFWLHEPAAPTGVWVPPSRRVWFRRTTIAIEIVFAFLAVAGTLEETIPAWKKRHAAAIVACPLCGAWHIDSATLTTPAGVLIPNPVMSTDKRPFVELDISSNLRASFRDDRGANSYFEAVTDSAKHTLEFTRDDESKIAFAITTPDSTHLILTPTGTEAKTASTMKLTLVSPPNGYPLLHRGFHWVSEYPYQK